MLIISIDTLIYYYKDLEVSLIVKNEINTANISSQE